MSRLNPPATEDIATENTSGPRRHRRAVRLRPEHVQDLASNPAVLEVVTTLQGTLSRVLDAKTRHRSRWPCRKPTAAVLPGNAHLRLVGIRRHVGRRHRARPRRELGRSQARRGRSLRATGGRYRGQVSDADLAAVRGAGYTDPQILAIVTVAVQFLLTNFINNVNQTDLDIPADRLLGRGHINRPTPGLTKSSP